ncbi:uncharacterized protein PG986_012736 [Apiospora aurea]|uniref:Uncharacterized protein n=1 Tax=Apiospora aurea TaxID=335848 RepID=A0ABR1Q0U9_9PEZI
MGGFGPDYRYALRYTQLFRLVGSVAANNTPSRLVRQVKVLVGSWPSPEDAQGLAQELEHARSSPPASFHGVRIRQTNEIAKVDFIAKLITTFPSLTHLSLGESADDSSDRVPSCLAEVEELPLTSIHVCANPGTGSNRFTTPHGLEELTATLIARSKGLRMLAGDCCIDTAPIFGSLQPRLPLAQLRVLRLTAAWFDEEELRQIITACPILCGLVYSENGYGPRGGWPEKALLEPVGAVRALASCRHTLRSLDLQLATAKRHDDMRGIINSRLAASFAGFTALQELTVQWCTVRGPISDEEPDDDDDDDEGWQQLLVRAVPDGIRPLSVIGCAAETRPERFGLFDPGNDIREALGAAGVRGVEYSMAWRTGFRSRAWNRAERRLREIDICRAGMHDFGPRNVVPDSDQSDWSDL